VTLVGYGVDIRGIRYWKIKNSWYDDIVLKTRPTTGVLAISFFLSLSLSLSLTHTHTHTLMHCAFVGRGKKKFDGGYMRIERGHNVLGIGAYQVVRKAQRCGSHALQCAYAHTRLHINNTYPECFILFV
jgi:hypothetical protein